MANKITDKCKGCGSCVTECPNGAISGPPKQLHVINPDLCDECADNDGKSACIAVCAEKAIVKA
jgi:ferredoxin